MVVTGSTSPAPPHASDSTVPSTTTLPAPASGAASASVSATSTSTTSAALPAALSAASQPASIAQQPGAMRVRRALRAEREAGHAGERGLVAERAPARRR